MVSSPAVSMDSIDVSLQRQRLLNDSFVMNRLQSLPRDVLECIRNHTTANFLDAVAAAALLPQTTDLIFVHFEPLFADICARWLIRPQLRSRGDEIVASLARILPFAPHLSVFLEQYIREASLLHGMPWLYFMDNPLSSQKLHQTSEKQLELLRTLLALWRLLYFDKRTYGQLVRPSQIQALFTHHQAPVRFIAIKIFCRQLDASDHKLEALLRQHIGEDDSLIAEYDGLDLDFAFLSLHEHQRAEEIDKLRRDLKTASQDTPRPQFPPQALTDLVMRHGQTIIPRPNGRPNSESVLVRTPTTSTNLENLAKSLQEPGPILLYGLPGSGKTSTVYELARELGMDSTLVTLHLNEQTDAKMLIGLYSTDTKPGSFSWRPGVLTTAVKEGRWVLIEDLDRAPNEVMSTLLPLIEHGKLLIPSRGETVEAPSTFRLFATVRTHRGMRGQESIPSLLGQRFWHLSNAVTPNTTELEQIITERYPLLHKYTPMIMSVFKRLCQIPSFLSRTQSSRSNSERAITPKDLLKWCRRLTELLVSSGCRTGDEPVSETTRDSIFMEAVDCFCGSVSRQAAKVALVTCIAEEMHLSKQLMEHYLETHVPELVESPTSLRVGRVMLSRQRHVNKVTKSKKPFASTGHARRLLEQIAVAVKLRESVLLVGETGIGKTTVVQQLAETLGHKLVAVNLSQQSEVGDLLGGFKPVNARSLAVPLKEEFEDLFASTGISTTKNKKYIEQIGKCMARGQWTRVLKLWREAPKMFNKIIDELESKSKAPSGVSDIRPAVKRRKTESKLQILLQLRPRWEAFAKSLDQFDIQIAGGSGSFAFAFVEGNIVKAARNGDWVLLDEINLASPDTLESIADLLASGPNDEPSLLLSETGRIERVKAHPEFRIFGAMNPATDIGKRDLPLGLRSRFTEIYVSSPDKDFKDLLTIVKAYLSGRSAKDDQAADDIARLYLNTKQRAEEKRLVDGANEVPHFSLRTLTRVLTYVNDISPFYGLRRSLFEGFSMGFLTLLDRASEETLTPLIHHHLLDRYGGSRSLLSQPPRHPNDGKQYIRFVNKNQDRQYWLLQGGEPLLERSDYIVTPYVERNLLNLVRATSTRRFPILIQGPTSAGKTSMIEYLANYSGNKFVRINNHEHTDLQEYLGTYVSDASGSLRFQEGLLVQALRQGHWIVLDELNLAPTDVLEALNRLLDENRELLIPETQEIVRPHENFMLFATQNPPGLYGGRKILSRAFRNRFLELHYDEIPDDELETILQKRSVSTAPSDCKRIVNVYKELSRLRQTNRLFEDKGSFATLRDLFRWALRTETRDDIPINGFMLLAERVRNQEERVAVKKVIENVFKVKIDPDQLYDLQRSPFLQKQSQDNDRGVVWTNAMRRLYVLVASALHHNEPVLLVGETGCGKTTVCQLLAQALGKELHIVNAHQNTETGDLIGSQRPIRNRGSIAESLKQYLRSALQICEFETAGELEELLHLYHSLNSKELARIPEDVRQKISENEVKNKALFKWADGSLVQAMRSGSFFLLDEISLADDSVLERLNSVLEPQRSLLLAEKGIEDSFVQANDGFQFLATMNPGGDFGKKELSPALRNRFTEIWVPPLSENEDVLHIVSSKLRADNQRFSAVIVEFSYWFGQTFRSTASTAFSIRDILVWVKFVNEDSGSNGAFAVVQGASTVFIDTLGANPSALIAVDSKSIDQQRQNCLDKLSQLIQCDAAAIYRAPLEVVLGPDELKIGNFAISRIASDDLEVGFTLQAPTTKLNAMRIIRALQVQKPILLEGSPGVGKTTLVSALASACGHPLTRINLSDQTDLMDLFGTDVPVEGAEAGHFAWRDAPFLRAMQNGEWVLLDEMNLASQSVLEGLNACLDHRGEVYVSELDQVFQRHPDFRLFAAQNPHHQGGGRKGLPSSFVNRFIVVYADVFTEEDLLMITQHNFPSVSRDTTQRMITFISSLERSVVSQKAFGSQGSPWEFNLRDTLRWLHLLTSSDPLLGTGEVHDFMNIIIRQRFRTPQDRAEVDQLFNQAFGTAPKHHQLFSGINSSVVQVGLALMQRDRLAKSTPNPGIDDVPRLLEVETLLICVKQNLPCILVGPSGSGKSMLLEHIAALTGKKLVTFPLNADIDTMDLVGGFEQSDPLREVNTALKQLQDALQQSTLAALPQSIPDAAVDLLHVLAHVNDQTPDPGHLLGLIKDLQAQISIETDLAMALANVQETLQHSTGSTNPRFEWLDGIIIQALQKGHWLVLDNANLCNASVLDRLNSLLEPNGCLVINEHCGSNGEPRVVRPHPNFRVFLTVDLKYGELSRAMRNRAVEIYISPQSSNPAQWRPKIAEIESSLNRLASLSKAISFDVSPLDSDDTGSEMQCRSRGEPNMALLAADGLSLCDQPLLERYARSTTQLFVNWRLSPSRQMRATVFRLALDAIISTVKSAPATRVQQAVHELGLNLPGAVVPGVKELQLAHPLQNSNLVPLLQGYSSQLPFWVAVCYELQINVLRARRAFESQRLEGTLGLQISHLNRLQRSCVADRAAAVSKDSTIGAARFLTGILDAIETYMHTHLSDSNSWKEQKYLLRDIVHIWWRTYRYLSEPTFKEARFQTHLSHVERTLLKIASSVAVQSTRNLLSHVLTGLDECFNAAFKLTTGLSMEVLWNVLRPLPIPDSALLQRINTMEGLARDFDTVRWKSTTAPAEMAKIMNSFINAYRLLRLGDPGVEDLLSTLKLETEHIHDNLKSNGTFAPPFLAAEFEAVRQISMFDCISRGVELPRTSDELVFLSNWPLRNQLHIESFTETSRVLQSFGAFFNNGRQPEESLEILPCDQHTLVRLLSKLNSANSANLRSLSSLQTEMPILARQISLWSEAITSDRLGKSGQVLWQLIETIIPAFEPSLAPVLAVAQEALSSSHIFSFHLSDQRFTSGAFEFLSKSMPIDLEDPTGITEEHIVPALVSLLASKKDTDERCALLANAWIQFSVALIKMFVPDKPFDPQLRPQIELESYQELLLELKNQLQHLRRFERFQTGQSSNLRCELLEEEIKALGQPPAAVQRIYRSSDISHPNIQGEFNSLLKIVLQSDLSLIFIQHFRGSDSCRQQLEVIHRNIANISWRLSTLSNGEFEDIVLPTMNILHCLEIGLFLAKEAKAQTAPVDASLKNLASLVPFLGNRADRYLPSSTSHGLELLSYAGTVSSIEGPRGLEPIKESVFEVIHTFYIHWDEKLEADRKIEEDKMRTFRYRGGVDDAEAAEREAFDELFPAFDEEDQDKQQDRFKVEDPRSLAIQIARYHKQIFLAPREKTESIRDLNSVVHRKISKNDESIATDDLMLPTTLLTLQDRLAELKSNSTKADYNFYTDRNLPEARQLVTLINDIRARFYQLQQVDEISHMQPLTDVISSCDRILELNHSEPLAKIILKVEQLHGLVYEWQFGGWASKVYGVLAFYTRLTNMLVSWRRLELSTWGRLFDMEVAKCDENASAWWFLAYQAIVAGPMTLSEAGEDLRPHAANLLKELETYFSSAPVGEFTGRLNLLRQLHKQLVLLATDHPSMSIIRDSLQNFVDFYARFEKVVGDFIRTRRAPIDKQMKDVLLLASWKDTNIAALRESARKSHQKLFRIVRKFRDVLGQPLKSIVDQGLPDEERNEAIITSGHAFTTVRLDDIARAVCQRGVPKWTDKYKRLANVDRTIEIMHRLGRIPDIAIDATEAIDNFLSNLNLSVVELRRETPSLLTDENKDLVKHLKSRKRKLFAETLKTARQMGFQYNLSTDVLSQQDSLANVLASIDQIGHHSVTELDDANYYCHKMLDIMPRIRAAGHEHSEDLTGSEVDRSIGFLEGILQNTLHQRHQLAMAIKDRRALVSSLDYLRSISHLRGGKEVVYTTVTGDHRQCSVWLVPILQLGLQLVQLHSEFGGVDNSDTLKVLEVWLEKVKSASMKWDTLPVLPEVLSSHPRISLEEETNSLLDEFRMGLDEAAKTRPDLAFVLNQICLWTVIKEQRMPVSNMSYQATVVLTDSVKKLCDNTLVAVEQYNKVVTKLLTSQEEPAWLMKHNEAEAASIRVLHIDKIQKSIKETIEIFAQVDLNNVPTNVLTTSLIAVVTSILEQYQVICDQSIRNYAKFHRSTCKLGYTLSKSFTQLARQGFCTPQEKSDETSGQTEKLEGGTGLGDGEGAEDISKDVQPDEDLSELAQEGNKNPDQEIEDEKDAVDMADEEMQGDLESVDGGEAEEKGSKSGDEDQDDDDEVEEETGSVSDLDPTAVDEKMWDGENEEEAEKDQKGKDSKGQEKEKDQTAADQKSEAQNAQPEDGADEGDENMEESIDAEEDEGVQQQNDINQQDQNVQDQDTLALPDDMEIDGKDNESLSSISDDELDQLSDVDQDEKKEDDQMSDSENGSDVGSEIDIAPAADEHNEDNSDIDLDQNGEGNEDVMNADEVEDQPQDHDKTDSHLPDDLKTSSNDVVPSEMESRVQDQSAENQQEDNIENKNAQQEDSELGESGADQDKSAGQKGSVSPSQELPLETDMDDVMESSSNQPFKALGDALEEWHKQRREIKAAQMSESNEQKPNVEQESSIREFQHIQDDETAPDNQAMGAATEDQAQPINEAMAIDDEEDGQLDNRVMPEETAEQDDNTDKMDTSDPSDIRNQREELKEERHNGVSTHQGAYNREITPPTDGVQASEEVEDTLEGTSTQLSSTHLSEPQLELRHFGEAMQQWTSLQSKTHPSSLSLTSQLRLILTPSQSTKLSGAFRTGKRLNIKRIIPYIASSYKRDKIWMRRAVPIKRSYQILLCVDDSKSMGESSSGDLALESLVMVSRALTMLEVGQIGVMGFGANVFMAHEFTEPFASHDAGAKVLQKFSFQQDHTDVLLLIRQTIERFRLARQHSTSRGSEDLWQLALILSDGLTPSSAHEDIRRLLREAMEERIMIVFIIMNKQDQSVLTLKTVKFLPNAEIKTEYYLDTFPFQYYLVVRNLEDLPSALAGLLRTWFAEVNN